MFYFLTDSKIEGLIIPLNFTPVAGEICDKYFFLRNAMVYFKFVFFFVYVSLILQFSVNE